MFQLVFTKHNIEVNQPKTIKPLLTIVGPRWVDCSNLFLLLLALILAHSLPPTLTLQTPNPPHFLFILILNKINGKRNSNKLSHGLCFQLLLQKIVTVDYNFNKYCIEWKWCLAVGYLLTLMFKTNWK